MYDKGHLKLLIKLALINDLSGSFTEIKNYAKEGCVNVRFSSFLVDFIYVELEKIKAKDIADRDASIYKRSV